jgi:hypothetical protein
MTQVLPLAILRQMWLQIDGAPPHFGRIVRDWCDEIYPNRWIGRDGAIACPPGHLTLILVISSSGVTSKILYMLRRFLRGTNRKNQRSS